MFSHNWFDRRNQSGEVEPSGAEKTMRNHTPKRFTGRASRSRIPRHWIHVYCIIRGFDKLGVLGACPLSLNKQCCVPPPFCLSPYVRIVGGRSGPGSEERSYIRTKSSLQISQVLNFNRKTPDWRKEYFELSAESIAGCLTRARVIHIGPDSVSS